MTSSFAKSLAYTKISSAVTKVWHTWLRISKLWSKDFGLKSQRNLTSPNVLTVVQK